MKSRTRTYFRQSRLLKKIWILWSCNNIARTSNGIESRLSCFNQLFYRALPLDICYVDCERTPDAIHFLPKPPNSMCFIHWTTIAFYFNRSFNVFPVVFFLLIYLSSTMVFRVQVCLSVGISFGRKLSWHQSITIWAIDLTIRQSGGLQRTWSKPRL